MGAYLLKRPQDIGPYLRYGASTQKSPLDLGKPWWSFGAVTALEKRLRPHMTAFEFGSGGSSVFLGERVGSLVCVEDETEWTDLVRASAQQRGLKNVQVLHRHFDFWKTEDFKQSDYLRSIEGAKYDVIVVDGKEWSDQVRDICFWHAENFIKPGGLIVVDDSWRYPQVKAKNKAVRWTDYKGTGFCRAGVTSTCIFEY